MLELVLFSTEAGRSGVPGVWCGAWEEVAVAGSGSPMRSVGRVSDTTPAHLQSAASQESGDTHS